MNNAVFGKSMENVFKQSKYIPVSSNDEDKIKKLKDDAFYIDHTDYCENLIIFEMNKVPIFNKPIHVGFTILELSKWKMYDIFYNGIKKAWPQCKLSYMDTDSLIVNIPVPSTEFYYPDEFKDYFDLSVYDVNSPHYDETNKGVLGKMKDEYANDKIKEFIAIRSKMYCLKTENKEISKCKGITRLDLGIDDFKQCLLFNEGQTIEQTNILSKKHKIFTKSFKKIALPYDDDKKRLKLKGNNYTNLISNSLI